MKVCLSYMFHCGWRQKNIFRAVMGSKEKWWIQISFLCLTIQTIVICIQYQSKDDVSWITVILSYAAGNITFLLSCPWPQQFNVDGLSWISNLKHCGSLIQTQWFNEDCCTTTEELFPPNIIRRELQMMLQNSGEMHFTVSHQPLHRCCLVTFSNFPVLSLISCSQMVVWYKPSLTSILLQLWSIEATKNVGKIS